MVIIGYSGTGKSVAIKHIVGLLEPDSGRSVGGRAQRARAVRGASSTRSARRSATSSSSPRSSTRSPSARTSPWACASRASSTKREIDERVDEALDLVDLPERARAVSRRALRRHAQARRHRARHRAAPQVHPLRRAHHGPRSGHERRHRPADGAHAREAARHRRRHHARHAQRVHRRHAHRDALRGTRALGRARSTRSSRRRIPSCGSSSRDARRLDDDGVPGAPPRAAPERVDRDDARPRAAGDLGRRCRLSRRRTASRSSCSSATATRTGAFRRATSSRASAPRRRRCARCARRRGSTTLALRGAIETIDWYFRFRGRLIHKVCHFFLMETAQADTSPQRPKASRRAGGRRSTTRSDSDLYANARAVLAPRAGDDRPARRHPPACTRRMHAGDRRRMAGTRARRRCAHGGRRHARRAAAAGGLYATRERARALVRAAFPRRRARLVARDARAEELDAALSHVARGRRDRGPRAARRRTPGARAALAREFPSVPFFGLTRAARRGGAGARAVRGAATSPTCSWSRWTTRVVRDLVLPPRLLHALHRAPSPSRPRALGLDTPLQQSRLALHRRVVRAAPCARSCSPTRSASRASTSAAPSPPTARRTSSA